VVEGFTGLLAATGEEIPRALRTGNADYQQSAINYVFDGVAPRNAAGLLNLLNTRTNLLSASRVFDEIALDRYTLMRDGYLARRRSQLFDGDPPDDEPAPAPYKSLLQREKAK